MKWETLPCDLCSSSKYGIFLDGVASWEYSGVFSFVKCSKCGIIYLNPRPEKQFIKNYYPAESYWGRNVKKFSHRGFKKGREKAYGFLYKEIFSRLEKGSVLDIGAGTGLFLSKFRDEGWVVDGNELSDNACKFAEKAYKINLKNGDFLDFSFPAESFDLITLNNSLEHLYSPRETLMKAHKLLKKGGLIEISVPNAESVGAKLFSGQWYALQPPRHLYLFSPKTIRTLLRKCGFKVLEIKHGYWTHNFYTLFESFRFMFSPRFRKSPKGGLAKPQKYNKACNIIVKAGKIAGGIFAFSLSLVEPLIKRGEVMTVYAQKT
jgi:SAM-dependent methyltransferase